MGKGTQQNEPNGACDLHTSRKTAGLIALRERPLKRSARTADSVTAPGKSPRFCYLDVHIDWEDAYMFILHVSVHVKPECLEAFREATLDNASNSVKEPGVARFDVVQQQDDPTRFELV